MKILFLSSQYLPYLGGVEIVVKNLAEHFSRVGHTSIVVTAKAPRDLPSQEIINKIPVRRFYLGFPDKISRSLFAFPIFFPLTLFRLVLLIKKEKIGIINLHFVDKAGIYALFVTYLVRAPLVVSLHGNDVEKFPEESFFYRQLLRLLASRADLITANSRFIFNKAAAIAPEIQSKGRVLGNGVNIEEIEKVEPYSYGQPFILGLGRLVPKKGFDLLINAFNKIAESFPNYHLLIAGDGPERNKLEDLVIKLSLEDRVHLMGKVKHQRALSLFKSCDLFVLPSRKEPFGVVLLEAMAAGAPIVATEVGGVPEFVKNGYNGVLVESGNVSQVSSAMSNLLNNNSFTKNLSAHGKEFVKDFSWSNVCKRYISVYEELTKQ